MMADKHYIPEGTVVSMPQYVIHRDPQVYGSDSGRFRPERWLEANPATLEKMEQSFLAVGRMPLRGLHITNDQ